MDIRLTKSMKLDGTEVSVLMMFGLAISNFLFEGFSPCSCVEGIYQSCKF